MTDTFDSYVKVGGPDDCWEWQGYRTPLGYGRYRRKLAHRISFARALGIELGTLHVCHRCDNPPCVNPAHLFLGTARDNALDRKSKDRGIRWYGRRRGHRNPMAKLTDQAVREIRRLHGTVPAKALGQRFGVSAGTVYVVQSGRGWTHVG